MIETLFYKLPPKASQNCQIQKATPLTTPLAPPLVTVAAVGRGLSSPLLSRHSYTNIHCVSRSVVGWV
jgi:hypothetical protein